MKIFDKVKKTAKKPEAEGKNAAKDRKKNKLSKDMAGSIIVEHLLTEKTSNLMPLNKYVFKVSGSANKNEVKKAVEGYYGVNVTGVNIIKTSAKPRRMAGRVIEKAGFKKAIVTLKEGESIELTNAK